MKYSALIVASLALMACSNNTETSVRPDMATVQAASFFMGETVDYGYGEIDGPRHEVSIESPFAFSVTEVTVGDFRSFVEDSGYVSEGICNIYTDNQSWHIA